MNGCSATRAHAGCDGAKLSLTLKQAAAASTARARTGAWLMSALFWFCAAFAFGAIGYGIAVALESSLLGFLGADFVFLIALSFYTSGQGTSPGTRR